MVIRAATRADVDTLRAIERAAGEPFRSLDMDFVADDEPPSAADLAIVVDAGQAWVGEVDGVVVGYALAAIVDGDVHLEQVSVHPDHHGNGHGRALIEHVVRWADALGSPAVTLTTFVEVPWNGPYYERLGFTYLSDLPPGLAALRAQEAARGLDRSPRAAMIRHLGDRPVN